MYFFPSILLSCLMDSNLLTFWHHLILYYNRPCRKYIAKLLTLTQLYHNLTSLCPQYISAKTIPFYNVRCNWSVNWRSKVNWIYKKGFTIKRFKFDAILLRMHVSNLILTTTSITNILSIIGLDQVLYKKPIYNSLSISNNISFKWFIKKT